VDNVHVPSDSVIPIDDKERLIADILQSAPFKKGERAGPVLAFLFERHKVDPTRPPTMTQIFQAIWGTTAVGDPRGTVRTVIGRIRDFLEEYFDDRAGSNDLLLTIPRGSYALHFERALDDDDVYEWFWDGHVYPRHQANAFCILPSLDERVFQAEAKRYAVAEEDYRPDFLAPYLSIYRSFSRVLGEPLLRIDEWNALPIYKRFIASPAIYIGDDTALPPNREDPEVFDDSSHYPAFTLHWAVSKHFRIMIMRDAQDRTIVLHPGAPQSLFVDSSSVEHVLLTRFIGKVQGAPDFVYTQTLLLSRSVTSARKVAHFLVSYDGLRRIYEDANLRAAVRQLRHLEAQPHGSLMLPPYHGRAPSEFQIVFSVTTHQVALIELDEPTGVNIEVTSVPDVYIVDDKTGGYRGESVSNT
jgi:hypothetical protein